MEERLARPEVRQSTCAFRLSTAHFGQAGRARRVVVEMLPAVFPVDHVRHLWEELHPASLISQRMARINPRIQQSGEECQFAAATVILDLLYKMSGVSYASGTVMNELYSALSRQASLNKERDLQWD